MSSTKIINVLKDDSFNEILDLFKSTSAGEVIFVLPKKSRAFQKEEHFGVLKNEAKTLDKAVSFLCSSSDVNDLAKQYGFDVLLSPPITPSRAKGNKKSNAISVVNQIEDFYTPKQQHEAPAVLASTKKIEDIIQPNSRSQKNVEISAPREKNVPLEVRNDVVEEIEQQRTTRESNQSQFIQNWFNRVKPVTTKTKSKPTYQKLVAGLSVLAVIVFGAIVYVSTGSAKITITPKSQPLKQLSLNITISDSVASIDSANLFLPGQLFHIQKTVSQEFPATGEKNVAQKARGAINIYNELTVDQPLVATTRFESGDGHIFRTLTSIVVPAAKIQSGKSVPGMVEVQVVADKAGQDYNVSAGSFTIPAFKEKGDATKHKSIYGRSTTAMRGGTSGKAKVVTEQDYTIAKSTLEDRLNTAIQDQLKSEVSGFKLVGDAQSKVDKTEASANVDEAADSLMLVVSGSLKTVGFKESDLHALISQHVRNKLNLSVVPEKLELSYSNVQLDSVTDTLRMTVIVEGPGYQVIDQKKLTSELMGKKAGDIKGYLRNLPEVSSASVILSPVWVRSVPKDPARVHIDFSY